jgi:hypothetical protein
MSIIPDNNYSQQAQACGEKNRKLEKWLVA